MSEAKVHKILDNAYEKLFPTIFEFEIKKFPVILKAPEILYVEVKRNDVYIHAVDKVYKIRESMRKITAMFDVPGFISTHRSYIINLEHYNTIKNNEVILKNGERIPLSRSKS